MGYVRNKTIVVSATVSDRALEARGFAAFIFGEVELGGLVSPLVEHAINGGASFFLSASGSKLGWQTSDDFDVASDRFIEWLRSQHPWLDWAQVVLGSDDGEYRIEQHAEDYKEEN